MVQFSGDKLTGLLDVGFVQWLVSLVSRIRSRGLILHKQRQNENRVLAGTFQ